MHKVVFKTHHNKQYQILCTASQDILSAGLSEGLALSYNCNNGICGSCIAQIINGKTQKIKNHDYRLAPQQIDNNYILMCCNSPASDVILKVQLQNERSRITQQLVGAYIKKIEFINNIAIIKLRMSRAKVLQYTAGQEAILQFSNYRSKYPIASCPCQRNEIEFHIRHNNNDKFANAIFNKQVSTKTKIDILGPIGVFGLKEDNKLPSIFIAWDVAFAPIRSIIEYHHALEYDTALSFYWAYPSSEQKPYLDQYARSWKELFHHYEYKSIPCKIKQNANNKDEISQQILQQLPTNLSKYMVYISVPAPMIISLSEGLISRFCLTDNLYAFPS